MILLILLSAVIFFPYFVWAYNQIIGRKYSKYATYTFGIFNGILFSFLIGTIVFAQYIYYEGGNNILNFILTEVIMCTIGFFSARKKAKERFDRWDDPLYKEKILPWD